MTAATLTGTCVRCQQPVKPGGGILIDVSQGTAASPGILLHRHLCTAPRTRRSQG